MAHDHDIGRCDYCGERVLTCRGVKDHTVGGISTSAIALLGTGFSWSEESTLKAA